VRKISGLHQFDCLRANKATAAWGVEARVPFLDRDFLDVAMTLDASEKLIRDGKMEKHILRKAFDVPDAPYLPHDVLWRQKEQFSDGVGYGWIDSLQELANARVTDAQMASAVHRFPHNTPATKEAYMYREIFDMHFASAAAAVCVECNPPSTLNMMRQ
jgi:asparagine synthase (glutamine-hydrolysing)